MKESHVAALADRQAPVTTYFREDAPFWEAIYGKDDVFSLIHRERAARALAEVARLVLAPGARLLEVGCGAGLLAIELARRGFQVEATDSTDAMIEMTARNASLAGVDTRLHACIADVHRLPFRDGEFELVVAMGVLPWLHSPEKGLREMARVLSSGGYLVTNVDNRARLTHILDPALNPALQPLRHALGRDRVGPAAARTVWRRQFDRELIATGLRKTHCFTLGFGPLTFFGRQTVRGQAAVKLHGCLQRLADGGVPGLRSAGAQYMVVAHKQ